MPKRIELKKGQQFGRLRIIHKAASDRFNKTQYLCQCICGNQSTVIASRLLSGFTVSCGCHRKHVLQLSNAQKFIDLEGRRFGLLKVIEFAFKRKRRLYWNCLCKCGNSYIANGEGLRYGDTTSCGCRSANLKRKAANRNWKIRRLRFGN
jgi:hypothetical protein